jgi:hypothetical protein
VLAAAESVALQVLRDALVPPETDGNPSPALGNGPPPSSSSRRPQGASSAPAVPHARSASSSVVYGMRAGKAEKELDTQLEREKERRGLAGHHGSSTSGGAGSTRGGGAAAKKALMDPAKVLAEQEAIAETPFLKAQTGREIAILTEQNSLVIFRLAARR